jgi:deazaflavin-dependent oxidoreductase (nitroreductase family)
MSSGTPTLEPSGSTRPASTRPTMRTPMVGTSTPVDRRALTRKYNPFTRSPTGGRILSALSLPVFTLHPPVGYGVLTTTGRNTGKTRCRCVHAVRHGNRAYIVMIRPTLAAIASAWIAGWVWNIRANPNVRLRIRGGTFTGRARELTDEEELRAARTIYCETVNLFDHLEYVFHRGERPTRAKIEALHHGWFDTGIPLVVELQDQLGAEAGGGAGRDRQAARV